MNKSQLQDLGIVNEELGKAINSIEIIKQKLEFYQLLATKQAEEITALDKYKKAIKRVRVSSLITFCAGGTVFISSYVPWINDKWKQSLFLTGIGLMSASTSCFCFSITIPF